MQKLVLCQEDKVLETVSFESEDKMNQFIWDNKKTLFPAYTFISQQFCVKEDGEKKFIDILAYNPQTAKYIIFELKIGYDEHVVHQAKNYRTILLNTFGDVFVRAQDVCRELPNHKHISREAVDIIIVAKQFRKAQINEIAKEEKKGSITLIKYNRFKNDIILLDYVHNAPDAGKTDSTNKTKKHTEIELETMTWDEVVNDYVRQKYRKKYLDITPDTKKNIDKLRQLANGIGAKERRTAVLAFLLKAEKKLE